MIGQFKASHRSLTSPTKTKKTNMEQQLFRSLVLFIKRRTMFPTKKLCNPLQFNSMFRTISIYKQIKKLLLINYFLIYFNYL